MAKLVTIFGGSGFVGRYVVQELAKSGARIRVATRDPHKAQHLKPLAALGQLDFIRADLSVPALIDRACVDADVVINLVGILSENEGGFDAIHVRGANAVAEAAAKAGAATHIYISAIGADPESESNYGRSKGEGELAVCAAFAKATILRPSIVFGPEDHFLNRFAALLRIAPVMPVVAPATKFQPIYVVDLARAVMAATDPKFAGKTLSIGGPDIVSMRGLLEWLANETGRSPMFVDVPDGIAGAMARLTGWLPAAPLTRDQWLMLQNDNVVPTGEAGIAALGIKPAPMAAVAPVWLVRFRKQGRFSKLAA